MLTRIKNSYFADKAYGLIYMHNFCRAISSAAMYVFTGAYFLKLGMPLHFVLLFYGLEFGVRGFLCPWGLALLNRVGIVKALLVSVFLMLIFFVGVSLADHNLWLGFGSLIFAAASGAIYYPFLDVMEAIYIKDDHNRTKQISMGLVARSIGAVIGTASVGFLITHVGFEAVVVLVAVMSFVAIIPFAILPADTQKMPDLLPKDVFKFIGSHEFRPLLKPFFGQQLLIIINVVMVPIFIFTIVGEIDALGYLVALALIFEKIITLVSGYYTDKAGVYRSLRRASLGSLGTLAAYMLVVKTPLSAFIVESVNKALFNAMKGTFMSGMHGYSRTHYPQSILLFGAGWQMTLCFGELIVLPIYALLAYFIGIKVFYIACVMGVLGLWLSLSYFKPQQAKALELHSNSAPDNQAPQPAGEA